MRRKNPREIPLFFGKRLQHFLIPAASEAERWGSRRFSHDYFTKRKMETCEKKPKKVGFFAI